MADYTRVGTEFTLNTATTGEQFQPSVAGFAGGGFVAVWTTTDTTQDGSGRALKFRLYDANGVAVGGETLVNNAVTGDQRLASVTVLSSGNFLVSWETTDTTQDGAGTAIKARLFSGAGVALGGEFRVNTSANADQINSNVTALSNGGFVVAWQTTDSTQDGLGHAIKAQRYDADGVKVGGEFLVNPTGTNAESLPQVTGLAGGGFLATWTLGSGTSADIYGQLFDASGVKTGAAFRVNSVTAFNQDTATAVQLADGRIVVTWASSASLTTGDRDIKAQVFSASGTPIGGEFLVSTTKTDSQTGAFIGSSKPQIDDLPDGGFVITWSQSSGSTVSTTIRGQFFDANAQRVGSEVLVNTVTDRFEGEGDVAVDGNGRMLAVWASASSSGSDNNIRGQFYNGQPTGVTILSNGGGDTAAVNVAENSTAVTTVIASGPAGIVYSIAGGADAARFTINATTGALAFAAAPNFEVFWDSDFNGIYQVTVLATSGALTDFQQFAVTVTNVNEAPAFSGGTTDFTYFENRTTPVANLAAVDPDGTAAAYSLTGVDAAHFTISASGVLAFAAAPDYEATADAGGNHVYDVTVVASDGVLTASRALTVELLNWNEGPVITSNGGGDTSALSIVENNQTVTYITLFDPEGLQSQGYTYTLSGPDAALFGIQAQTGYLYFGDLPDFEAPTDANGDGVYQVTVSVSDGFEPAASQALSITVTNGNEGPAITSNGGGASAAIVLAENTTAVTTVAASDPEGSVSYAIAGGSDAALFAIDASTGALRFLAAPDREAPADAGADNVYNVFVRATDGALFDTQALAITVANANEAVTITSDAAFTVADDGLAVTTVTATDLDGTAPVFAIAGGADAALFAIDPATGELSFIALPDFDAPGDADGDNVYDVVVSASDGSLSDSSALTITVVDAIDPVVITSDGGGNTAATSIAENTTAVTTVSASGGVEITYAIAGGADATRFTIDAATGALAFAAAPNFEWHDDSDGDHVYQVIVSASSGELSDFQQLAVTVTNVNEAPVYIGDSATTFYQIENFTNAVATTSMLDPEGDAVTYALAGADAAHFAISTNGVLAFVATPDFENPTDADGDRFYDVTVLASDGSLVTSRALEVEVLNWNEGPTIISNGGGDTATLVVSESTEAVTFIAISDPEGHDAGGYTYSLSGADAALFRVFGPTGYLYFLGPRNFEAPSDANGDGIYDVTVTVSDRFAQGDSQALSVTIANVNEGVTITSGTAFTVAENGLVVTTVSATDLDGTTPTYAIAGGADAARFVIDPVTGALSFVAAPDFEAPADADGNNVYQVVVSASDGSLGDTETISVTVGNANEAPSITSNGGAAAAAISVDENATAVIVVAAVDPEGSGTVSYAITGGTDASRFQVDATTGALAFAAAPDFEAPADADGDNVYEVVVTASDGALADSQALSVSVGNRNDNAPVLTPFQSDTIVSAMAEGNAVYFDFGATDADGGPVSFSLAGADAASLSIDTAGVVRFDSVPDYEVPGSSQGTNSYVFDVIASDGAFSDVLHVTLHVFNLNEPLAITSNGGGDTAALTVAENGTGVTTVVAHDNDLTAPVYAIAGGADAARFTIDAASGALAFVAAPDFEAVADADGDNIYEVTVTANDGTFSDAQALSVTVANVNEAPTFVSGPTAVVAENQTAVAIVAAADADGDALSYTIAGGADAALFTIDASTGALNFIAAPDVEAPGDADGDGTYLVAVSASDGTNTVLQAIAVAVSGVNEGLVIVSNGGGASAVLTRGEGASAVTTVAGTDVDGDAPTYSIVGGADASLFAIDAETGELSFVAVPDFEAPGDADGDNVYQVVVSASDGEFSDVQDLTVTVDNVNEAPRFVSDATATVREGAPVGAHLAASDPDGNPVTYAITGGADAARFLIVPGSGTLWFDDAPDFEAPADANGDNVYVVEVSASDGSLSITQSLSIAVTDYDEAPVITSLGGASSGWVGVLENTTLVMSAIAASDPEGSVLSYAIAGGADAARFAIDAASGELRFVDPQNYELPVSAGGDMRYYVVVSASDGSSSDTLSLTVELGNVIEPLEIVSGGGGDTASVVAAENSIAVTAVVASNPDSQTTYAIWGGADAARFLINSNTGALSFVAPRDFEAPGDADGNNVYEVTVRAYDHDFSDYQSLSVTVANVNEAPVIASNGGGATAAIAVGENATAVTTVAASDPDGGLTYSLVGGADAARFTIDAVTGAFGFVTAPNFEAPTDVGGNNVYEVIVSARDGSLSDTQALTITVGNINEAPMISSGGGGDAASYSLNENATIVAQIAASDPEGSSVTYTIAGGADAGRFTIDSSSGTLAFLNPPDFDAPADAGGNNVYDVTVRAVSGSLADTQALSITVGNLVDGVTMSGTSGANTLTGTYEEDSINGLGGNDRLIGGAAADRLTGGTGGDRFVYQALGDSTLAASDLILDFSHSQGDKIDLLALDANTLFGGNQAFSFIGSAAFSSVAGELRYVQQGSDTFVQADVNGDGIADFRVVLDTLVAFTASDFIL